MSSRVLAVFLLVSGCSPAPAPAPATPPTLPSASATANPLASAALPASVEADAAAPPPPLQATSISDVAPSTVRVPSTEPTTDVAPNHSVTIEGLTIRVTDILVKRLSTGGEMLRATAHLSAGGKHVEQKLDSDGAAFEWNGYLIELRGGSNEAAGFAVVRAPRKESKLRNHP